MIPKGNSAMNTLRSLYPGQPATEFRSIQQIVDRGVSPRRFFVLLVAALAEGIAGISVYSALNACIGSTRDARQAGTIHANAATASNVAATVA